MMMEWSPDSVLEFIKDVEGHPALWDSSDPFYKMRTRKEDAWSVIATKYDTTPEEVKRKWQSLQASFRREKLKEASRAGRGSKKYPSWFAFSAMKFLEECYTPRKVQNVVLSSPPSEEVSYGSELEFDYAAEEDGHLSPALYEPQERGPRNTKRRQVHPPENPRKKVKEEQHFEVEQEEPVFPAQPLERRYEERDDNVAFGEYITKTLQKLDDHSNAVAKHRISQILFEATIGEYRFGYGPSTSGPQARQGSSAPTCESTGVE